MGRRVTTPSPASRGSWSGELRAALRTLLRVVNQVARIGCDVDVIKSHTHQREDLFANVPTLKCNCAGKVCTRKGLHDDDILIYNRTVPEFECVRLNPITATKLTLIGGDKHGSQEKESGKKEKVVP
jgi:hypothetical protein